MTRALVFAIFAILLITSLPSSAASSGSVAGIHAVPPVSQGPRPVYPYLSSVLTLSRSPLQLPAHFWGTTISPEVRFLPNEADLINATPARVFVWPGGDSGENYLAPPLNGTLYDPTTGLFHTPATNESTFIGFCRMIRCTAIFQVPAEINDSATGASIVGYTENTLGFHPWAWEIGNEPERWTHTSLPWAQWGNGAVRNETPLGYAWIVNRYSIAMRAVDPSIRIFGLPGTGRPQGTGLPLNEWINATVQVNGPNLSGVAFHDYPGIIFKNSTGAGTPLMNLSLFYKILQSPAGLTARVTSGRSTIANQTATYWPGRPQPPMVVTEIGSGLSDPKFHVSNFSSRFPGALSLAAQMTQALSLNVTNIDIFQSVFNTSNSWFDLQGNPRPDYALYSDILSRLGPTAFNATFSGFNGSLYAIATTSPSPQAESNLMAVNLNLTDGAIFTPQLPDYLVGSPVEVWTWNGTFVDPTTNRGDPVNSTTPAPVGLFYPTGLPASWALPPQSLALFESFNLPAAPVLAAQLGLAPTARWFLGVDGGTLTADTPTIATFLPSGVHTTSAVPLNVTLQSRNEPFLPASISVGSGPSTLTVPFTLQWRTNLTVSPAGAGTLSPDPVWWNTSSTLSLNATAAPGYVFNRWDGHGLGNYSGTGHFLSTTRNWIDVTVQGPLSEKAALLPGYTVTFQAVGLPASDAWSASVHYTGNFTDNIPSTGSNASLLLPQGKWGFTISAPAGYSASPGSGAVNVTGSGNVTVTIRFAGARGPGPFGFATAEQALAFFVAVGLGSAILIALAVYTYRERKKARSPPATKSAPKPAPRPAPSGRTPPRSR